jgi:hypothetical protein
MVLKETVYFVERVKDCREDVSNRSARSSDFCSRRTAHI